MKFMAGKYYVGIRFANDLFVGFGRPSQELLREAVLSRPHRPKFLFQDRGAGVGS